MRFLARMPISTFDIATCRTYLVAYETAYRAGDYETARIELNAAETVRLMLPDSASDPTGGVQAALPNLQWFKEKKAELDNLSEAATATSRKRIIQAKVGYHDR